MSKCLNCGAESGKYALCFKCNNLKEEGKIIKCDKCGKWHDSSKACACENYKIKNATTYTSKETYKAKGDGKCIICEKDAPKGYLCLECYKKKEDVKKDLDYLSDAEETKDYYNNLKYNIFKLRRMDYAQNACQKLYALAEILENNFNYKGYIDKGALAIKDLLQKKKDFLMDKQKVEAIEEEIEPDDSEVKEDFRSILNQDVKDYRKIYPMNLHCTDGHYVRSKAEREIDNYFYNQRIVHVYEQKYRAVDGQEYYPDFFIPELKLYIEYFGKDDEEYLGKAEKKMEIYAKDDTVAFDYLTSQDDNIIEDRLEQIIWKRKQKLKNF